MKQSLAPEGLAVIDFMNVNYVANNLVAEEVKTIDGIEFKIRRTIRDNYVVKTIVFSDQGKEFKFEERVAAMTLDTFKAYFEIAEVKLLKTFGDYELSDFNPQTSERLILVFK